MKTVRTNLTALCGRDTATTCHNLRPLPGGALAPVGQLRCVTPAGMKAVLLFSAPEGLRLLCADARHRLYVTDAVSGGGEDVTEAFYTGDEAPLCAEFTGDTLLVMYAGGLKTFSYPGLRLLGGAVPATLPGLRAVPAGRLVVSVRSRQLATEGLRTATALVAADARAVEADYRAAVATLAAEARAQGVLTQPVLARYVLEDAAGNDVFTSPAVLLGTAQLGGTRTAAVDSGGLMAGYTVEADTWRLHLEVPAGLEDAGVRRIRVMVSPQFQTVLPEQSAVDLRLAHPSTGQYVAQVAVGLRPVAEALLPSNADAAARVVADAVARMAALERCVAQTPAGAAAHTLVCGAAGEPAEEYADVSAALRRAVTAAAPADVLTAPPHSFSARCAAVAGRTVMWGNISPRRFRGYPVQLFAATTRDKSWRGYIAVDFADGGRVVWSAAESTGAPDAIGPLLSYPAPDAVAMTVVLAVAGEGVVRGRFDLAPLADGRSSAWLAPGLAPFRLTEEAAEGEDTPPGPVDTGSALPDCVVAADAAAPAWALASARGFGGEIRCMLPAAGGTAAWDFGRERVAVFSSGGLFTAALGSRRDVVAAGRIDGRRVEDASAVVRGTDGDVYVIASGALLRLRGRSVATLLPDAGGASALAFDPARRELWLIGGGTAKVICTAAADLPVYTRGAEGAAGVLDSAHGSVLLTPDGVKAVGREEATERAEVAWQADVELPAGFRPRTACLRMAGTEVALFASLAAAGQAAAERVPTLGLRVSGDVADTLRVRLVSRPLRRMRLRLAGAVGADFRFHGVELHNA